MGDVFVSYRRADSSDVTGRIYDHLTARFGRTQFFKDVDSIPIGDYFRKSIIDAISKCKVLLVVIGDDWLTVTDKAGVRRIDDLNDYVHVEVSTALTRGVTVIPVLVEHSKMPSPEELPAPLRELAFRNAAQVRPDPDYGNDINLLCARLEEFIDQGSAPRRSLAMRLSEFRLLASVLAVVIVLGLIAAAIGVANRKEPNAAPSQAQPNPTQTAKAIATHVVKDDNELLQTLIRLVRMHGMQHTFTMDLEKYADGDRDPYNVNRIKEDATQLRTKVDEVLSSLSSESHKDLILAEVSTYEELTGDMLDRKKLLTLIIDRIHERNNNVDWRLIAVQYEVLYRKLQTLTHKYHDFLAERGRLKPEPAHPVSEVPEALIPSAPDEVVPPNPANGPTVPEAADPTREILKMKIDRRR